MTQASDALPKKDDSDLVGQAAAGDSAAFAALIGRYFGMIHAIAFARLGHREAAEDLAQETFLRAHLGLADLRDRQHFAPWIARIARNLASDWVRDEQRRSRIARMVPIDPEAAIADPQAREGRKEMMRREEDALVREAIFRLEPEAREIVILRYTEEMGVAEIARKIGVHRITVRRHLKCAISTLRRDLEATFGEAARAWRGSKQAAIRTSAIVAGAAALSAGSKSALAAAASAGATAVSAATRSVAALPGAGSSGLLQSTWAGAWAWLAGGGVAMTAVKTVAVIALGAVLTVGTMHYQGVGSTATAPAQPPLAAEQEIQDAASPVVSLPPGKARGILERAEGLAALLNVEAAESLTSQVLASETDPRVRGAAYWVRAMVYTRYDLEYRTNAHETQRLASVAEIARLHAAFLDRELPTWEIARQFTLPPPTANRVEEMVSQARITAASTTTPNAANAFRLGRTVQQAAVFYRAQSNVEMSRAYMDEAARCMEMAAKLRPGSYEYQAYYLTVLSETNCKDEAEQVGARIARQFADRIPYPPVGDKGPLYLQAAAVSLSDPARAAKLMARNARLHPRDAWLQTSWALDRISPQREGRDPAKSAAILANLVNGMETGAIETRGTGLQAMGAAYFKLGAVTGQYSEALDAYRKLAALSPHYGMLHFNRAIIYRNQAGKETDPARKRSLLEKALAEAREQMAHNYHGIADSEDMRKVHDQLARQLGAK